MPEIIIDSSHAPTALTDAINRVTNGGSFPWQFSGWTTNNKHKWNGRDVYTGMRGIRHHHSRGWQNFTIRHDFDYAAGLRQNGGKGYHVNVELPGEKYAFVTSSGLRYAEDCWDHLSQRITNDGEEAAAHWFMMET